MSARFRFFRENDNASAKKNAAISRGIFTGSETRTQIPLQATDFESVVSTISPTRQIRYMDYSRIGLSSASGAGHFARGRAENSGLNTRCRSDILGHVRDCFRAHMIFEDEILRWLIALEKHRNSF